jgi:hypothetical protein
VRAIYHRRFECSRCSTIAAKQHRSKALDDFDYSVLPCLPIQRHSHTATPTIKSRMPGIVDPRSQREAARMMGKETAIQIAPAGISP